MLALVVTVRATHLEWASDQLWARGVMAIEERCGAATDVVELWTTVGNDVEAAADIAQSLTGIVAWRFEDVNDAIAEAWRDHVEPIWVDDDLVIAPAWRLPEETGGAEVIVIDPGSAFGMGDHPTTMLSLRALRAEVLNGAHVLDVGCGSGVLAIAALRFGAAHVDAIDISVAAVEATVANLARNAIGSDAVTVWTMPLAELTATYDVVVANILAPVLVELAPSLVRSVRPGGTLIVSGLLAGRHDHVTAALLPLRPVDEQRLDGWVALTLRE